MSDRVVLVKLRGATRAVFTRNYNKIDADNDKHSENCKSAARELESLYGQMVQYDKEMIVLSEDSDLENEISVAATYASRMFFYAR